MVQYYEYKYKRYKYIQYNYEFKYNGIAAVGIEGLPNHFKDLPELNIICKIHSAITHSFSENFKFSL